MTLLTRRKALLGLFAAPAIIKLAPLMKIKPLAYAGSLVREAEEEEFLYGMIARSSLPHATWRLINQGVPYANRRFEGLPSYAAGDVLSDLHFKLTMGA